MARNASDAALPSATAAGGWSADPASNLALADRAADQVQVKLAPLGDGRTYASWYDNAGGGYDPTLQLLNSDGVEQWAHNGVKVADTGFSWVTDYGLSVDSEGAGLLAFRDDRGGTEHVTIARISPAGDLLWGTAGVSVSQSADFVGPPKVLGTTDGQIVAAWAEDAVLKVRRMDLAGESVWEQDMALTDPAGASYFLADLQGAPNGGFIVSWVRNESFNAPRHLYAQRFTRDGAPLWGVDDGNGGKQPLAIFANGTLQYGNFPYFVPDLEGGAVFAWYETTPDLQVRVQRVRPDGTVVFPPGGMLAATARPDLERVEPGLAYDPGTEDLYVFWRELPVAGGLFRQAVRGQRFDAAGQAMWGEEGREILPSGPNEVVQLNALPTGDGVLFAYVETLSMAQDQRVWLRRLDAEGVDTWSPATVAVSSAASTKSRLALASGEYLGRPGVGGGNVRSVPVGGVDANSADAATSRGPQDEILRADWAILAWQDGRSGSEDIFAQNVNPDGSLGPLGELPTPTATGSVPPTETPAPSPTATEPVGTGAIYLPVARRGG